MLELLRPRRLLQLQRDRSRKANHLRLLRWTTTHRLRLQLSKNSPPTRLWQIDLLQYTRLYPILLAVN